MAITRHIMTDYDVLQDSRSAHSLTSASTCPTALLRTTCPPPGLCYRFTTVVRRSRCTWNPATGSAVRPGSAPDAAARPGSAPAARPVPPAALALERKAVAVARWESAGAPSKASLRRYRRRYRRRHGV